MRPVFAGGLADLRRFRVSNRAFASEIRSQLRRWRFVGELSVDPHAGARSQDEEARSDCSRRVAMQFSRLGFGFRAFLITRRHGRNADGRQQAAQKTPKSADLPVQRAAESARTHRLHVPVPSVRAQSAHGNHHRGAGSRVPKLWKCEKSRDFGLFEPGRREQEEAAEDPTAGSGVKNVGIRSSFERSYGFVHFAEKEAREKALIPAMRIFGVKIRDCLCRTEPAENKRTLFVGNIDRGVTGDEVSEELNALLKPQLQVAASEVCSSVDRTA